MFGETGKEMPRYQSHKKVWALKIAGISFGSEETAKITPADEGYAPFLTRPGWAGRYQPNDVADLGYYVVYEDGFTSWSPTKAFEEGYSLIEN